MIYLRFLHYILNRAYPVESYQMWSDIVSTESPANLHPTVSFDSSWSISRTSRVPGSFSWLTAFSLKLLHEWGLIIQGEQLSSTRVTDLSLFVFYCDRGIGIPFFKEIFQCCYLVDYQSWLAFDDNISKLLYVVVSMGREQISDDAWVSASTQTPCDRRSIHPAAILSLENVSHPP